MHTAAQAVRGGGSADGCPGSCKTGLGYKKMNIKILMLFTDWSHNRGAEYQVHIFQS